VYVSHLLLHDFRSYADLDVELDPGPTAFIGRNGQGKTNLVEAIDYLSRLSSHRVATDAPLVRADSEQAVVRAVVVRDGRQATLEVEINPGRSNRARVNRAVLPRARDLVGLVRTVVFSPEDLSLVKGDPSDRRHFLDDLLIQRTPRLAGVRADYDRVLKQRNSLLKTVRLAHGSSRESALDTLEVWDAQLVELGSRIMVARRELLSVFSDPLQDAYRSLVGGDHAPRAHISESVYQVEVPVDVSRETVRPNLEQGGSWPPGAPGRSDAVSRETIARDFSAAIASVRRSEIERAVTLIGPHRDDLVLELNGLPVKGYASHGESWSFALGLRLALARILREESPAGDPVLILDDVFAELDAGRRARLMSAVRGFEQVIVTAAVESDVPDDVEWHRVRVHAGQVIAREDL